jgi:CubicO group peptidase (beta-lactamase class C family)
MRIPSILIAALAMLMPSVSAAAEPAAAPALTRADVDAWLDGLMPAMMHAGDIPGGIVTVVKNGQVLTTRGYGYADVATRRTVDPRSTLFAFGSVSKVFTATAVMQLVEQGKVDLDADVNRYLDFRLPPRDGRPITLRQLLTHTAGFEEKLQHIVGRRPMMPLDRYMKEWVPARIFPAGEVPAYSNYGSALVGYIVERVSGQAYDDYMDRHVLGPLGMDHSTLRRPVPARLLPLVSSGYESGSEKKGYLEYFGPAPAGSLLSTGADVGRFMIAHLQRGRIDDRQILLPRTADRMHTIQPKIYPALRGMALGFYEHSRNGHRVLAHNGGTQFFLSDMHLFLDDGVGLFVSLNSPGKDGMGARNIHEQLFHGFADRYFPVVATPLPPAIDPVTAQQHAAMMAGAWENSRRAASSPLKLLYSLVGTLDITANADGTINVPLPTGMMRGREIAPFLWRAIDGEDEVQAILKDGRPHLLGWNIAAPLAYMPVPGWRSPGWMVPALGLALSCLLVAGLAWPIGALIRRRFKAVLPYSGRAALAYRAARGLGLGAAIAFLGTVGAMAAMAAAWDAFGGSIGSVLIALQALALLLTVAALLAALADAALAWPLRGWWRRGGTLLLVASAAMLLWTELVFHFANLSGNY